MSDRRICAGYYRRYDGKVAYVVSLVTDADTGEETVIWTAYPFADVPRYYTSSKKSFCAFVEVDGERKAKYKRLLNMRISEPAIERLADEGFRGPVRKRHRRQPDKEYDSREYQQAATYHAYAKELCENHTFDQNKYRLCVKEKRFAAITKSDFAKLKEDLQFLDNAMKTDGGRHGAGDPLCVPGEKDDGRNRPPLSLRGKLYAGAGTEKFHGYQESLWKGRWDLLLPVRPVLLTQGRSHA